MKRNNNLMVGRVVKPASSIKPGKPVFGAGTAGGLLVSKFRSGGIK